MAYISDNIKFKRNLKPGVSVFIKRVFDIIVSIVALIFSAPLFVVIAFAIKRDSPGPVFYFGDRIGYRGKIFRIYKFRTMFEEERSYQGTPVTAHDDDRITPVGKWLRDTKLNEIPQFINVLKGEMSLVGPRPEDPALAKTWPKEAKEEILSVRPGITSPATILYHNEELLLSSKTVLQKYVQEIGPDKTRLDQLYVSRQGFILDLDILFWTAIIMMPLLKRNTPPEKMLFVGPITRFYHCYMSWTVVDILISISSITILGLVWRLFGPMNVGIVKSIIMAIVFTMLFSVSGFLSGIYQINWPKAQVDNLINLGTAWLLASLVALVLNYVTAVFPITLVIAASFLILSGFVFARYFKRIGLKIFAWFLRVQETQEVERNRVLIVGTGRTAEHASWMINHPSNAAKYQVVGFVVDELFEQGMRTYCSKVIGTLSDLPDLIHNRQINLVILADHQIKQEQNKELIDLCHANSVEVLVVPDIFGSLKNLEIDSSKNGKEIFVESIEENFPCDHCVATPIINNLITEENKLQTEI